MKEETHTKAQAWTACRLMIEILDIFFTNVSAPFFFFAAEPDLTNTVFALHFQPFFC